MGRDRLLRVVCDQHDVHGEGVGHRGPTLCVSGVPGDFLRRLVAGGCVAGLAELRRAASDGALPRSRGRRLCVTLRVDRRARRPGVRRGRHGAGEHGARGGPVSAGETRAAARDRRRRGYGGLGARSSLRRHHGAVHELAVPVLDQSARCLRDLLHHMVGARRAAAPRREGRHRLARRHASWRRADSAQSRAWHAGGRRRGPDARPVRAQPVLDPGSCRRVRDFSLVAAAQPRSHSQSADLLEPQRVGRERRESARRLLHHGGARERAHLHQRRRRRGHDEGGAHHRVSALRVYDSDGRWRRFPAAGFPTDSATAPQSSLG